MKKKGIENPPPRLVSLRTFCGTRTGKCAQRNRGIMAWRRAKLLILAALSLSVPGCTSASVVSSLPSYRTGGPDASQALNTGSPDSLQLRNTVAQAAEIVDTSDGSTTSPILRQSKQTVQSDLKFDQMGCAWIPIPSRRNSASAHREDRKPH